MEEVRIKTRKLIEEVRDSINWADSVDDDIAKNGLKNAFKSVRRSLSTINNSLKRRPSIAIFGQSQVGKSYLVQNLTKAEDEKFLKIKVADGIEDINFLTEMNPDGGKESTGLVTRFTTGHVDDDITHPFHIEIFGQLDVAAILINGFWSDLKDFDNSVYEFDQDELKALLRDLKTFSVPEGINEDDVHFFNKYLDEHFRDISLFRDLKKIGFFKDLEEKLPFISSEERWRVLSVLWGKNKFFTQIFKNLTERIKILDFEKDLRVEQAALSPNTTTLIDIERVREVFRPESENDKVSVKLNSGKLISIERSYLSILTKEVQLKLASSFEECSNQAFLNTVDVLDFPGSKSREKIPLSVFSANSNEDKLQIFIRGKVSYLFDFYSSQLGVSTLLYCMDDSPPEEKEAPSRLYKWVQNYVGRNVEDRTETLSKTCEILNEIHENVEKVSPLLVVFTKFNQEINNVLPGEETSLKRHDSKWQARFEENFLNFMSRPVDDKWITNWTENENNFKFIFPVRDPLYSQATFDGFESGGRETKIRPEREDAMEAMETSFIGSDIVINHTLSPQRIWDELSSPNGTGIDFLAEQLQNSAHTVVTKTRLELELGKIYKELLGILTPHLVSGDLDKDLAKAKVNSLKMYTSLISIGNSKNNSLSRILASMTISDTEIWNLLYNYVFGRKEEKEEVPNDSKLIESFGDMGIELMPGMSEGDIWAKFREFYEGFEDAQIDELIVEMFSVRVKDIPKMISGRNEAESEELLAEMVIKYWVNKVMDVSLNDEVLIQLNSAQQEAFRGLVSEIIKGQDRFKLRKVIADTIMNIKTGAISNEDLDLVASCCTTILNKYLFSAGWAFAEENEKPQQEGQLVFSEIGKDYDTENLDYTDDGKKVFLKEWSLGCRKLYEENVLYEYNLAERDYDVESQNKLNAIVSSLEAGI